MEVPKQYRTREGEATAIDTKTQLTTLGSETAPGPLLVPEGAKSLAGVIVAGAGNMAAAGASAAFIRLEGPGLPEGPETFTVGAVGGNSTSGVQVGMAARQLKAGVKVTPGNEILIFVEFVSTDIGQYSAAVTLVFD